jgi:hypothetical protein
VTAATTVGALAAARRRVGAWVLAGLAAAAVVVGGSDPGTAQEAAKGKTAEPKELFPQIRGLVREGKYDLAAVYLRAFVASDPPEDDLLYLEKQYGTTVFQELGSHHQGPGRRHQAARNPRAGEQVHPQPRGDRGGAGVR